MRYLFTILLLCAGLSVYAQKPDGKGLLDAAVAFDKALVTRDSAELNKLLNNDLSYGHSNGWIQSKKEVIADLFNGKLTYKEIKTRDHQVKIEGATAYLRTNTEIECVLENKPLEFKLKVLQVWIWKNKHWELFARQSVKM